MKEELYLFWRSFFFGAKMGESGAFMFTQVHSTETKKWRVHDK